MKIKVGIILQFTLYIFTNLNINSEYSKLRNFPLKCTIIFEYFGAIIFEPSTSINGKTIITFG